MRIDTITDFEKALVPRAVLKNSIPAMAAMLMVLIYNLADTFFIAQIHNDILVAAVSLATPVFLIFMAIGTIFGIGGTSVISRSLGQGRVEYAKKRKLHTDFDGRRRTGIPGQLILWKGKTML